MHVQTEQSITRFGKFLHSSLVSVSYSQESDVLSLRPRPVTLPVVAVASRAAPAQTTQFFVADDVTPGVKFVEDSYADWLKFTKSHSDWSTNYEAGKVSRPIRLPPRNEWGLSIGRKSK